MKKLYAVLIIVLCVVLNLFLLTSCLFTVRHFTPIKADDLVFEQPFTPEDKTEYMRNPDCGFYQPLSFTLKNDGINYNLNNYLSVNNLLHLRMNLSEFRQSELTDAALADLYKLFDKLRDNSVNAIIRFAYDGFNGIKNQEPPIALILKHIEQLGAVLYDYSDVLTAVEVGMIGPWGEMHSSDIAVKENFNALIDKWLKVTNKNTPILARRPKMISDYLGIAVGDLENRIAAADTDEYRLGVFNDGYLGSQDDLGTYVNRDKEIKWLNSQAAHTPFGGEVTIPGSAYNKIDYAGREMYLTHTSYLNELWNNDVIDEWKNTEYNESNGSDAKYYGKSAYDFIRDHLGYRLTIKDIELPINIKDKLKIKFDVLNDGFGNLLKNKISELIIVGNGSTEVVTVDIDPTDWLSNHIISNTIDITVDLKAGEYSLYLRMREPSISEPTYCVIFANGIYDANLHANHLGKININ